MSMDKIVLNLKIKTLTPIHIGGSQEKHYVQNLDYVQEGDKVYILDETKLISHFGVNIYSNALATNTTLELLRSIDKKAFAKEVLEISGDPGQEIKRHIRNQFDNKPIIPGSSLKGAIRSVFLNYLIFKNNLNPDPRTKNIDVDVFGKISDDAMRFIQIVDTSFDSLKLFNTKIMNLQKDRDGWYGGWKQSQNLTNSDFSEKGFTTGYECIDIGQESTLTIILNLKAYNTAKSKNAVKYSYALDELFTQKFEQKFLEILHKYSRYFVASEVKFIDTYKEYDLDYLVKDAYDRVSTIAKDASIVRLGAGSGFHAMTGDWQFEDHTQTGEHPGGRNRGKKRYKSRRFAFEWVNNSAEEGEYIFHPMGFVQLSKT